jgi:hypothetical protein
VDNRIKVNISEFKDIEELNKHLRIEDINECMACGDSGYNALLKGYIYSDECYTAYLNKDILGMFGVSNTPSINAIWFLGSDNITKVPIAFIQEGRKYVKQWQQKYGELWCCADKRNTTHIKYIKAIDLNFVQETLINNNEFLLFKTN